MVRSFLVGDFSAYQNFARSGGEGEGENVCRLVFFPVFFIQCLYFLLAYKRKRKLVSFP